MARYKELGIKYNSSQPRLSIDEIGRKALTYRKSYLGANEWWAVLKQKFYKELMDICLDLVAKYGIDVVKGLLTKFNLSAKTQNFIVKVITFFIKREVIEKKKPKEQRKGYSELKEEVIDYVSDKISLFLNPDEIKTIEALLNTDKAGEPEQVQYVQDSIKSKLDEVVSKWNVQHNADIQPTSDEEDINTTSIPNDIIEKAKAPVTTKLPEDYAMIPYSSQDVPEIEVQPKRKPIQEQPRGEGTVYKGTKTPEVKDNTTTWVVVGISAAIIIGLTIFLIYTLNKKKRRRR